MSPTERTLKSLLEQGYTAGVVERWIPIPKLPGGGLRKDLFGFGDIVACRDHILLVQCTSGVNVNKRLAKIMDECRDPAKVWLECGGRIEVWGWRELKVKVNRRSWQPRIVSITLEDLDIKCVTD